MTTQTDRITPEEFRAEIGALHAEIASLHADLAALRDGLKAAAATAPARNGSTYQDIVITEIILGYDDKGQPTYKGKGIPYQKFGIRIWPEILPTLGIDPTALKPGANPIEPLTVRAEMVEITTETGETRTTPRKIISLAT